MSPYRTPQRRSDPDHEFARHVAWPDWTFGLAAAWAVAVVVLLAT